MAALTVRRRRLSDTKPVVIFNLLITLPLVLAGCAIMGVAERIVDRVRRK